MTTREFPNGGVRFNGKCKCGARFSTLIISESFGEMIGPHVYYGNRDHAFHAATVDFVSYDGWRLLYFCRGCHKVRSASRVVGKFQADKKCDGRCTGASGHDCTCSCGGKNHGAGA